MMRNGNINGTTFPLRITNVEALYGTVPTHLGGSLYSTVPSYPVARCMAKSMAYAASNGSHIPRGSLPTVVFTHLWAR